MDTHRLKHQAIRAAAGAILPAVLTIGSTSIGQAAGTGCDAGAWPLSAIQARFGGTLPTLVNGDSLPALGTPALVNLSAQADVKFPHAPGRAARANPAYAAVVKLGAQPAGTYQITVSDGAWIDLAENGDLDGQSGYVRRRTCAGVDKSIRFKTGGGPLAIQISGVYAKTIKIEAARAE